MRNINALHPEPLNSCEIPSRLSHCVIACDFYNIWHDKHNILMALTVSSRSVGRLVAERKKEKVIMMKATASVKGKIAVRVRRRAGGERGKYFG